MHHTITGSSSIFLATVLLGLREELGDGVPALSVAAALAVVIGGLMAVVAALHEGVRQLAPPSILYHIASQARDLMAANLHPDDDPAYQLPEVGSPPPRGASRAQR